MHRDAQRPGHRALRAAGLGLFCAAAPAMGAYPDKAITLVVPHAADAAVPYQRPAEFGRFLQAEDERYRSLATGLKLA